MSKINPQARKLINNAVEKSAYDPAYFLRFFLTHWFPSELPPFHLGLIALRTKKVEFLKDYPAAHDFLLKYFVYTPDVKDTVSPPQHVFYKDAEGNLCMNWATNLNFIIPRGYSKTTLNKGISVYECLTDNTLFEVFISETATHSETQLNDIKVELETNDRLRAGYGNQVPTKADSEKWTAKELHLKNGAVIVSKGRGGQVRGMTFQGRRPNKITLDDVEDDDSVRSDEQRAKTLGWLYSTVIPAGQIMEGAVDEEWAQEPLQIVNLGTMLAAQCLVVSLTSDVEFGTIKFGAVVDEANKEMLWDYKMSWDSYQAKRWRFRQAGQLDKFTCEYDSLIRVGENDVFPATFAYKPVTRADLVDVAIAMDPAISDSKRADDAAIMVVGRDKQGRLHVLEEWGGQGKSPTEKLQKFFELHRKWMCTKAGIEAVAYQAALLALAKEKMAADKYFFIVIPITHNNTKSKEARIVGMLSPRYNMGWLSHVRPMPKLESNLLDWPGGKRDYADATAMACGLLGETAGLMMEDALEDLPAFENSPIPELQLSSTRYNYDNNPSPVNSGRYG